MSYILEALRRAQDERQAQPPLAAQGGVENRAQDLHAALPPWLLAALAGAGGVLAASLLAWALWPKPAAPPAALPAAAAEAAALVPPPAAESGISSLDELATSDAGGPPAESYFSEVPPLADETQIEAAPASTPPPALPVPAALPAAAEPASRTLQLEPAPQPAEPSAPPARLLRDMPEDYRAAFPRLKVEVHVYDANPAERFVLIEGRRYREGESVAGAQLLEISADGLVLGFRGAEVLLPVGY